MKKQLEKILEGNASVIKEILEAFPTLNLIAEHRHTQDVMWGGPEHDDTHNSIDWTNILTHELACLKHIIHGKPVNEVERDMVLTDIQEALIKIAAVAVAAHESLGRTGRI